MPVLLLFLGFMAIAIAVFAYPVVRGLTKRIERLQAGVETLGAGNLSARVDIEGRDEVARLAESFNRAAARIEELIGAHRLLLANASHELRTPLSRLRLGIELYEGKQDPKIKAELQRDIAELDHLIDEILLASRLDVTARAAGERRGRSVGAGRRGMRALRRLHARRRSRSRSTAIRGCCAGSSATSWKTPASTENRRSGSSCSAPPDEAVLSVIDAGAGLPPSEHEHIFMPFYRLGGDRKGAGLGLSLVRQIARLHGGEARLAPRADAASCFEVRLKA